MTTLLLIRGLPGCGKSTFAETFVGSGGIISTDDFFMVDGEYRFDPTKLGEAHQDCQQRAQERLASGESVAVANTFCERWEMEPYLQMAKWPSVEFGARVFVVDLYDGGLTDEELAERNTHGVPLEVFNDDGVLIAGIRGMRARYKQDWKNGDPRPPWERT